MSNEETFIKNPEELRLANEKFAVVWAKVVGQNPSPIVPTAPVTESAEKPKPLSLLPQPLPEVLRGTVITESHLTQRANPHQERDFPTPDARGYLGSGNRHFSGFLDEMIEKEWQSWLFYRHLSRKLGFEAAKSFATLAKNSHKQCKELIAAYFLISGIHITPKEKPVKLTVPSYLAALRQCFLREQQMASLYTASSTESEDLALSQLFESLGERHMSHAKILRTLVEQL